MSSSRLIRMNAAGVSNVVDDDVRPAKHVTTSRRESVALHFRFLR